MPAVISHGKQGKLRHRRVQPCLAARCVAAQVLYPCVPAPVGPTCCTAVAEKSLLHS